MATIDTEESSTNPGTDFDSPSNEEDSEQDGPLDLRNSDRKLVTQPYDFSVAQLAADIKSHRIELSIEYQREFVWDSAKSGRLIESLLLNVPIPVCYFAESEDGTYEVIDGLQRLSSISQFISGDLKLRGLSVLPDLNGKTFGNLELRDQRRLQNRTIRCIVITEESDPDIKFDVFERLNTGAAVLNAQELRNSVYRGEFNNSLRELARDAEVLEKLGVTRNFRMHVEEITLRFFALNSGIDRYSPPLRQFLNNYMRSRRKTPLSQEEVAYFKSTLALAADILGAYPFRGPNSQNPVNKAVFDAVMIPLARVDDPDAVRSFAADISDKFDLLQSDKEFSKSIGRATADKTRMYARITAFSDVLSQHEIQTSLDLPGVDGNPGELEA